MLLAAPMATIESSGMWPTPDPRLNLTPGEEAQLAAFVRVPTGEPCHVDVVVLGAHFDQNLHCGQWKASAVSLPIA